MDFNKSLFLVESNFVKDALDKVITGEFKLTDREKEKLLSLGLIGKNGKPTQKAKEQYSELFEAITVKDLLNKHEDGEKLSVTELDALIRADLITKDGKITKKAKAIYPELFESTDSSLSKIYDEGKAFAKKWMEDNKKNISYGKYDGDIKVSKGTKSAGDHNPYERGTKESRAWKEGIEDAMFPSASRSKNPYI